MAGGLLCPLHGPGRLRGSAAGDTCRDRPGRQYHFRLHLRSRRHARVPGHRAQTETLGRIDTRALPAALPGRGREGVGCPDQRAGHHAHLCWASAISPCPLPSRDWTSATTFVMRPRTRREARPCWPATIPSANGRAAKAAASFAGCARDATPTPGPLRAPGNSTTTRLIPGNCKTESMTPPAATCASNWMRA